MSDVLFDLETQQPRMKSRVFLDRHTRDWVAQTLLTEPTPTGVVGRRGVSDTHSGALSLAHAQQEELHRTVTEGTP